MSIPSATVAGVGTATDSAAKTALAWTHTARFLTTASRLDQLPPTELPEIAFVGRSNAGKSTAINRLAQQKRLAFASRTPGRTQHINLFEVGPKDAPDALFADLPGYGYAAVERAAKLRWQEVMAQYLAQRRSLSGVVLMIDSRHRLHRPRPAAAAACCAAPGRWRGAPAGAADEGRTSSRAAAPARRSWLPRPCWLRPARSTPTSAWRCSPRSKRVGVDDAAMALHAWTHGASRAG